MSGLTFDDREASCVDGTCTQFGVGTHSTFCNQHLAAVEAIVARAVNEALTEAAEAIEARVPARRKHHFAEVAAADDAFRQAARIVRARAT